MSSSWENEEALGRKWDYCLKDAVTKVAVGAGLGLVFSFMMGSRRWPIPLGIGSGLGMALSNCQHEFRTAPVAPASSSVQDGTVQVSPNAASQWLNSTGRWAAECRVLEGTVQCVSRNAPHAEWPVPATHCQAKKIQTAHLLLTFRIAMLLWIKNYPRSAILLYKAFVVSLIEFSSGLPGYLEPLSASLCSSWMSIMKHSPLSFLSTESVFSVRSFLKVHLNKI